MGTSSLAWGTWGRIIDPPLFLLLICGFTFSPFRGLSDTVNVGYINPRGVGLLAGWYHFSFPQLGK